MKATSPNVYTQYAARFSTVGRVFGFPVSPECPVAVERGAFLRDNTFGKIYLQLRLRNCGRGIIRSVYLQGVLVNAAGQPMANSRFTASYDEVFCDENGSFGTKNLIMVDAPQKYVQLESVSVVMGDGSAREFAGTEFPKVLQVRPFAVPGPYYDLVDNAGEVMVEPYRYGPDTYLCNCGTLVIRGEVCPHCRKTWQTVSEESSLEGLAARRTRSQTSGNDGIDLSDATAAAGAAAGAAARASRETAQNIQRASRATAVQAVNIFERIRPYFGLMVFGVFMLALLILAYAQPEGSFLWFESYRSRYQWLGLDEITYYEIHNIAMIPLVVVAVLFGPQAGVAFGVISSLLAFMNSAYWWDGRIYAVISTLLDSYLSVAMSSMVEVTSRYGLGEYLGTVVENLGQDMEITMQILLNNGLLSVLITTLTAVVLFFLVEDCFPHIFREKKVTDASVQGTPAQN